MGVPEEEITVTGTVREDGVLDLEAAQGDNRIIRNAEAEIRSTSP